MRLHSAARGLLVCLILTIATAAQQPPAGKVDVVLETDTDLDYTSRLHNRIVQHAHAAAGAITDSGEVRVRFRIRRDGEAQKPIISLSSSKPVLDDTALKAVTDALAHAEPLPAEITRSFVDFQARFLFNQAPPQKTEGVSLADLARQRSKRSADGEKKVFTNEEVATTPDPEPASSRKGSASKTTSPSTKEKSSTSSKSESSRSDEKPPELDPQHYRDRVQPLTEQLSQIKVEIDRVRYYSPQTTAGMPTISNSQKNELERLERKKADIEKRIAAICDEARRNDVSVSPCYYY